MERFNAKRAARLREHAKGESMRHEEARTIETMLCVTTGPLDELTRGKLIAAVLAALDSQQLAGSVQEQYSDGFGHVVATGETFTTRER